jgi:hypothetical protein
MESCNGNLRPKMEDKVPRPLMCFSSKKLNEIISICIVANKRPKRFGFLSK